MAHPRIESSGAVSARVRKVAAVRPRRSADYVVHANVHRIRDSRDREVRPRRDERALRERLRRRMHLVRLRTSAKGRIFEFLDARIAPLDAELRLFAQADPRAVLLDTIPGVAELLALTIAVEIGEISRFASPAKLVSYDRLAPRVRQSGHARPRSGPLSKSGSRLLGWAAVEAAQQAWRESNPSHELYLDVGRRSRH